jgi:hypothetical protein
MDAIAESSIEVHGGTLSVDELMGRDTEFL